MTLFDVWKPKETYYILLIEEGEYEHYKRTLSDSLEYLPSAEFVYESLASHPGKVMAVSAGRNAKGTFEIQIEFKSDNPTKRSTWKGYSQCIPDRHKKHASGGTE